MRPPTLPELKRQVDTEVDAHMGDQHNNRRGGGSTFLMSGGGWVFGEVG